jgi:hypothetical protein
MKKAFLNKNKQINKYFLKYCEMRCWELGRQYACAIYFQTYIVIQKKPG